MAKVENYHLIILINRHLHLFHQHYLHHTGNLYFSIIAHQQGVILFETYSSPQRVKVSPKQSNQAMLSKRSSTPPYSNSSHVTSLPGIAGFTGNSDPPPSTSAWGGGMPILDQMAGIEEVKVNLHLLL